MKKDLKSLTQTEDWIKIKRLAMMAEEEEAKFDELEEHNDDDSSATEADEGIDAKQTDDEKAPKGGTLKMKNYHDEINEVAFDYNVMT